MQMNKIIAFDSWTGGVVNIERLVTAFKENGLDLFLIHIGSWGHDLGRPPEENIGNLLVRDISYYGGLSFKEILLRERPAAVLFLSTQAFAHRAFNRYCRQLGIPTVHLYHGVVGVQNTASKRLNPVNVRSQLALVWSRLSKNLFLLWPLYAKALWQTGASVKDWLWFAHDVWRQVTGQSYTGVASPDASTTLCCVYTYADIAHAANRYRLSHSAVIAVGNPDLEKFGVREEDMGVCLSTEQKVTNEIMYIDTALIEIGAVFDDMEDFVRHLRESTEALACQEFKLVVKLHPIHYSTGTAEYLGQAGVELCANEQFLFRLKSARAAIVEPSSAALIPALLGLPLLLARFGKLVEQEYGAILLAFPRARELYSMKEFALALENVEQHSSKDAVRAWINANAGPLPSSKMQMRVADACAGVIARSREAL